MRKRSGASLIAAERRRQVGEEGYTPEHDDNYGYDPVRTPDGADLARAAACYADPHDFENRVVRPLGANRASSRDVPARWPWHADHYKPTGDRIRDLTKAGALIAAEIDRLQRVGEAPDDPA